MQKTEQLLLLGFSFWKEFLHQSSKKRQVGGLSLKALWRIRYEEKNFCLKLVQISRMGCRHGKPDLRDDDITYLAKSRSL